jgi:hypothetical protein
MRGIPQSLSLGARRQIAEGEAGLRQQQNLYEAVRSDRNLYSKNLIAAQDEILDLKRKFKILVRAAVP